MSPRADPERDKLIAEMYLQHYTLKQINRRLIDEGYAALTYAIMYHAVTRHKAKQLNELGATGNTVAPRDTN